MAVCIFALVLVFAILSFRNCSHASEECTRVLLGEDTFRGESSFPEMSWTQTPSVVNTGPGQYRVLSRAIHLEFLIEELEAEGLKVDGTGTEMQFINRLEVLTDTLYVKGNFSLRGIKNLQIYARDIVTAPRSQLDLSAPRIRQEFENEATTGSNGEDGKDGVNGNTVEIFTDVVRGTLEITANGSDGNKGQDGGPGAKGKDGVSKRDRPGSVCSGKPIALCEEVPGQKGGNGEDGGAGGNAGKPGNGGNSGTIKFHSERIIGSVILKSCLGKGATAAKNGPGGAGGQGGRGSRGRECDYARVHSLLFECKSGEQTKKASDGAPGTEGPPGNTPDTPGIDGVIQENAVSHGNLKDDGIEYPLELLHAIKRRAEDVLLGNSSDASGRAALELIVKVANGEDAESIKNDARRTLGFLGQPGYDIFGYNELFAPRIRWRVLLETSDEIKNMAITYEEAFNGLKSDIEAKKTFTEIGQKISAVGLLQVVGEKTRLIEARRIALSEKGLYVKGIQDLEEKMGNLLETVKNILPKVVDRAKFNTQDFLLILQGLGGFVKAGLQEDINPLELIDPAIAGIGRQLGKGCIKSLDKYLGSIKKWLTFGEKYSPLEDSSDLDFDKLNVSSVPEIMQVRLELNKEALIADFVCLLEVNSLPQDIAELKQNLESFFISGEARIELIAKILDLDNQIGGFNYDIPVLEETEKAINEIGETADTPISQRLQLMFLENLLSIYRELERSFMLTVYELKKAFRFRTLWEDNDLLGTFRRVATESAHGTGRLSGILQITEVLKDVTDLELQAVRCFTNNVFTTGIKKWTFDSDEDKLMFQDIASGFARFDINIGTSCSTCFNIRLLKIYIELTGDEAQADNVPATVYVKVRHLSGSFFRAGDGDIKQYHQPLGSFRSIRFDRFRISDKEKCRIEKEKGTSSSHFCVEKDDRRFHRMCSDPLKQGSDRLLGEEECKSPFGLYELQIPVDKNLDCDDTSITTMNCKDLDLTKFTKMNVWGYFYFWPDNYPTGPNDRVCRNIRDKPQKKQVKGSRSK